ncbi:hypothetical protein L0152_01960, partial [bacterium]|nr:hypothetical protein [bacterium]
ILSRAGIIGADRRLVAGVHLIGIGDYFDWGLRHERHEATKSGIEILSIMCVPPLRHLASDMPHGFLDI